MNTEHERDNEDELTAALRQLPRELAPEADLWPRLQSALEGQPRPRRALPAWPLAVAAALAALWLVPWPGPAQITPRIETPAVETVLVQTYEEQKALQLAALAAPAIYFGDWQQQLLVWDGAVAQVRYALDFHPDDPRLLAQLEMLYQQQLRYLQQIAMTETTGLQTYY